MIMTRVENRKFLVRGLWSLFNLLSLCVFLFFFADDLVAFDMGWIVTSLVFGVFIFSILTFFFLIVLGISPHAFKMILSDEAQYQRLISILPFLDIADYETDKDT